MSKYEWEQGTIRLPTSAAATVRRATAAAVTDHQSKSLAVAQQVWSELPRAARRDPHLYAEAVDALVPGGLRAPGGARPDSATVEAAAALLWTVVNRPHRILKSDLDWPTTRTMSFRAGDASIVFNRPASTVTWRVDGNRMVERAGEHPVAAAFFGALERVRWTRKSGGVFTGNDEYNQDSVNPGDGANYVTMAFGPLGEAEAPHTCLPYTDSAGRRHCERVRRPSAWI